MYLRDLSLKENQEVQFQQFSCVEGAEALEELFVADKINYDYDPIEIGGKKPPKRRAFDFNSVDVGDQGITASVIHGLEKEVESSFQETEEQREKKKEQQFRE